MLGLRHMTFHTPHEVILPLEPPKQKLTPWILGLKTMGKGVSKPSKHKKTALEPQKKAIFMQKSMIFAYFCPKNSDFGQF